MVSFQSVCVCFAYTERYFGKKCYDHLQICLFLTRQFVLHVITNFVLNTSKSVFLFFFVMLLMHVSRFLLPPAGYMWYDSAAQIK